MKKWFNIFSLACVVALLAASCKKDETRTVANSGGGSTLTASTTNVTLDPNNPTANAISFNWTAVSYGYDAVISYVLQLSPKDSNFSAEAISEVTVTGSSKTFTAEDLNKVLVQILPAGRAADVSARVGTYIGSRKEFTYSNVVTFSATPYKVLVPYPSLWVPGAYQGWSPSTAPTLASANNDGAYEGYIYMKTNATEFKLTSIPDWSGTNYGYGGVGMLSTNPPDGSPHGGNLFLQDSSNYFLTANTKTLKWTSLKISSWSLIGNAIPGSNWDKDVDLIFDPVSQTWSVTTQLDPGDFKFRSNHSWDSPNPNYGDKAPADGIPDTQSDNNIKITETGTYQITLDLSSAGPKNYSYTIKKK